MVVVKLKPMEEILGLLHGFERLSVVGCELGSARCRNGGLKEAKQLSEKLEKKGFRVVDVLSLGGTCILERVEKQLFGRIERTEPEVILSLACGAGTQVIAENVSVPVLTGVDTLFIGAEKGEFFEEYCIACGDCIISHTGGICPVARCPKSLVNGPCGGAIGGVCEVDPSLKCIWFELEERLSSTGIGFSRSSLTLRDYSHSVYPRRLLLGD